MNPAPHSLRDWRRYLVPATLLAMLGALLWWYLSRERIEEVVRQEEVEMFDLAVPPPPPPPPPEIVPPEEVPPEVQPVEAAPQPDPLKEIADKSQSTQASDVSNLPGPTTDQASPFTNGNPGPAAPPGNANTSAPPRRAVSFGMGTGDARASRAYAESVSRHIQAHVRRAGALKGKGYRFNVRVSVSPSGGLSVRSVSGVDPAELADAVRDALAGLPAMTSGPPEGKANTITVNIRNT